ncbi:MAG TPA: hypothetical protein DCG06_01650 [Deltaproteobacteria bacterium]|nr:hypothetical protein [Deltaproteobacteria bacterium]
MAESNVDPRFEPEAWATLGFSEKVRISCEGYVQEGIALPWVGYAYHALKLALLVAGWFYFVSFTPGMGGLQDFSAWWAEGIAFQKAFLWASLFEVMGFGCMSGPLGGRMLPPHTSFIHYLWPGSVKLAPFPNLPLFGGHRRSWLDVVLYAALLFSLARTLVLPELYTEDFLPIIILLPLCALGDKTIPLAARVEHHFAMLICFLLSDNWIAGAKWVQLAIWFWAGVSKLTVAFAYVVPIMTANNPLLKNEALRKRLFVSYPDDLHPSLLAKGMAHAGTFLEFAAPLTLIFVTGPGPLQVVGIVWVLLLHGFILSNLPIAAVFEWNVLSLYAAFFLFVGHPEVSLLAVGSLPLAGYLLAALLVVPILGNLFPSAISFLLSMRYYAGNWAWNAWLFHGDSYKKLERIKRVAPLQFEQLEKLLPPADAVRTSAGYLAFRTMHLQGRVLGLVLPQATAGNPFQEYTYVDGEMVSAMALGWNFGEGHLGNERLLEVLQKECGFEEGEVRTIMVEAQPLVGNTLHWRVADAKTGQINEGYATLDELAARKPWDLGPL